MRENEKDDKLNQTQTQHESMIRQTNEKKVRKITTKTARNHLEVTKRENTNRESNNARGLNRLFSQDFDIGSEIALASMPRLIQSCYPLCNPENKQRARLSEASQQISRSEKNQDDRIRKHANAIFSRGDDRIRKQANAIFCKRK